MGKFVLVCALFFGFGSLALAAEGDGPCAKDRETFCAGIEPGGGAIAKCMKDNKDKLSPECKAHYEKMKEHHKEMKEACHDDMEKFCADVKAGKGRMMKCMKEHKAELSAACQDEMAKMKVHKKSRKGN